MSRYSGKQYKGAARDTKTQKRREAEERNSLTKPDRRRQYREDARGRLSARRRQDREDATVRLLVGLFLDSGDS